MAALDVETTCPLPEEARVVTASVALVGGGEPTEAHDWLSDVGGVEIPDEAAAIHGVTTQRAQAEGAPARAVIRDIVDTLTVELAKGRPLVVFNARYDVTVLDRECRRHGILSLSERQVDLLVVDPMLLDKWLDRYRKSYPHGVTAEQAAERGISSSRTLAGMCAHYATVYARRTGKPAPQLLAEAHQSAADAIACARLALLIGRDAEVVRRVRNAADGREKAGLVKTWDRVRDDLRALHAFQAQLAAAERARFAEYKASIGEHDIAARVAAERGWPVLDVMAHETAEAA